MASEKFANLAETTLSAGYTAGAGSISVTSAAGFPTAGVFRVRLGNAGKTIWRVDSVSGTTFTGAAEANDANANSGDSCIIVASKAVAERMVQSPEAGEPLLISGAAAADVYAAVWKTARLDSSSWTWVNQGTATIDRVGGIERLGLPAQTTTNVRGLFKSIPATPFVSTVPIIRTLRTTITINPGIFLRESATGKLAGCIVDGAGTAEVLRYTNSTTFGSTPATLGAYQVGGGAIVWYQIAYDGTNVTYRFSLDGINFIDILTEAKNASFTTAPDQIGFASDSNQNLAKQYMTLLGWRDA